MRVITSKFPCDMGYLKLYPMADVHYGAAECMEREFAAYIKQIQDDPSAAVLLAGDLINNGIKSSITNVYEEKYTPQRQKRDMVEMLYPIRDKIVSGVRGNHEYRTVKESCQDVMEDIFERLEISDRYARDAGFIKISLGEKQNKKPATYMIYLSHGSGGGVFRVMCPLIRSIQFIRIRSRGELVIIGSRRLIRSFCRPECFSQRLLRRRAALLRVLGRMRRKVIGRIAAMKVGRGLVGLMTITISRPRRRQRNARRKCVVLRSLL